MTVVEDCNAPTPIGVQSLDIHKPHESRSKNGTKILAWKGNHKKIINTISKVFMYE